MQEKESDRKDNREAMLPTRCVNRYSRSVISGIMIQDDRSSDSRRVIDGVGSQTAQSEVVDGIRRLKLTWRRGHQSNVRWLPDR